MFFWKIKHNSPFQTLRKNHERTNYEANHIFFNGLREFLVFGCPWILFCSIFKSSANKRVWEPLYQRHNRRASRFSPYANGLRTLSNCRDHTIRYKCTITIRDPSSSQRDINCTLLPTAAIVESGGWSFYCFFSVTVSFHDDKTYT